MSRNLGRTDCYICHGEVALVGPTAPITAEQAMAYLENYEGMEVANALCMHCGAKYLAWVDERRAPRHKGMASFVRRDRHGTDDQPFFDLSFRSAFNDEPAPDDLPSVKDVRRELADASAKVAGLVRALDWLDYYNA